ncbi:DUF5691 domain-containing protein [Streptomyces oceani]|uniref:Uncharacterized protein n=1 Tax=Streptomyces oceani TaxID=1075402 RepID=A0A1E7KI63_9ACTN|nr:DUF5691 domain-containing protein [Streptomyces oceani]OEV03597.1 hypothetical protein AN216_10830 [Streptomyces oceani]
MNTKNGTDSGTPWHELVTAALLGAERRDPPGGSSTALLDAAAVQTLRHRAGGLPVTAGPRPEPAPVDRRPELPTAAARRLARLLAHRSGGGGHRGTTPDLAELLPQWLAAANGFGFQAPAAQLPALLDAARARTDLRPLALEFAGPGGRWLARLNPEWKFALRTGEAPAPAGAELDAVDDDAVRKLWQEGLFAERVTLLTALRRRDPDAGLALLAADWSKERAEDRLMFLDSLRTGLSSGDESFLEGALRDRSRTVRATAAELLSALPGSALAARMAERARSCVSLDTLGERASTRHDTLTDPATTSPDAVRGIRGEPHGPLITVEAPHECDTGMQRDGVTPKPPSGRGERAWWLGQLVEFAPLDTWAERFGGRTPAQIATLPVADGWREDLHAAWCLAAVRQRDAEWARALVGDPEATLATGPGDPAKLLAVLPAEERAGWVARFIEAHGLSEAFRVLGVCAVPWSGQLSRAVLDALEARRAAGGYPWSFSGVMGLAERCLEPAVVTRTATLAAPGQEPETGTSGAELYWSEAFQRLDATLRLRTEMLTELRAGDGSAPEDGKPGASSAQAGT